MMVMKEDGVRACENLNRFRVNITLRKEIPTIRFSLLEF